MSDYAPSPSSDSGLLLWETPEKGPVCSSGLALSCCCSMGHEKIRRREWVLDVGHGLTKLCEHVYELPMMDWSDLQACGNAVRCCALSIPGSRATWDPLFSPLRCGDSLTFAHAHTPKPYGLRPLLFSRRDYWVPKTMETV